MKLGASSDMESMKLGASSDMESMKLGASSDMESMKLGASSDMEGMTLGNLSDMEGMTLGNSSDMESMTLGNLSDDELLYSIESLLGSQRRLTALLLSYLAEVEERRLHLRAACSSMFDFCTRRLGMSEGEAFRRITGARIARQFPEVLSLVEQRKIHLSALCLLRHHLTEENHTELFRDASRKSRRDLEALLAARFPKPDVPSSMRKLPERVACAASPGSHTLPLASSGGSARQALNGAASVVEAAPSQARTESDQSCDEPSRLSRSDQSRNDSSRLSRIEPLSAARYRVEFTIGPELKAKLERSRNLLSHAHPTRDLAAVVERGIDLLLAELEKKKLGKTRRSRPARLGAAEALSRTSSPAASPEVITSAGKRVSVTPAGRPAAISSAGATTKARSGAITRAVRRAVFERDGERCAFVDDAGRRCSARALLELDHLQPSALGGSDETANLRVLCRAHNQLSAELTFGREYIEQRRYLRQRKSRSRSPPARSQVTR